MDTQASNTPHSAPTPWWKGLIVLFVTCSLLFGVMSLMSGESDKRNYVPNSSREINKNGKAKSGLYINSVEAWGSEEARDNFLDQVEKGIVPSNGVNAGKIPDCDNFLYKYVSANNRYFERCIPQSSVDTAVKPAPDKNEHQAIYPASPAQESAKKAPTSLPPVKLNTESTTPLSRERLRIHEELVKNLLL